MNTSPPRPPSSMPPRRLLIAIVLGALAIGLLIFLLIWGVERHRNKRFYTADPNAATSSEGQVEIFQPLPAPMAGENGPLAQIEPQTDDAPTPVKIIEPARPAPPTTPASTAPQPAAASSRATASSAPVPISQVSPRYPREALRSGTGGLVRVAVDVGPDGVPTSVSLAEGSGSRALDRAALDAVRRWRFTPATQNGQPSVGRVIVPIEFTPN